MERKSTRNINLLFFEYKAYYDENDEYIVEWEIDWFWLIVVGFVIASLFGVV